MAIKFRNPPVIYTVAKIIFVEPIANYPRERYERLLEALMGLGFDSYVRSKMSGFQLKHADNSFSVAPTTDERVGYFSADRTMCVVIDEHVVELRLAKYSNHTDFLNTICEVVKIFKANDVALTNKLREIELHYVDLFVPKSSSLQDMFSVITLPNSQFYSDGNDRLRVGAIQFTRVLPSGREKVAVNLEQLKNIAQNQRKYVPDVLIEPDGKLAMPLNVDRFFSDFSGEEYAIVHTNCAALMSEQEADMDRVRLKFEELYQESRKTFDAMIQLDVCNDVWIPVTG